MVLFGWFVNYESSKKYQSDGDGYKYSFFSELSSDEILKEITFELWTFSLHKIVIQISKKENGNNVFVFAEGQSSEKYMNKIAKIFKNKIIE